MTDYKAGIYFNMPEHEYHDIPYFSRSFADNMIVDCEDAWYKSAMNPDREPDEPTSAMAFGTALHSMILEPELFKQLYVKMPTPDDFEGKIILDKNTELADFLASVGEKKSGTKAELINRAQPYLDPHTHVIWENVMASFYEDVQEHGRRILTESDIETLAGIKESLSRRENLPKLFEGGYPEVTIIWQDESTGVMCKCRIDYLKVSEVVELKSFSLKRKKNIYRAMCDEINYERYNMQYVVYREAVRNIIRLLKARQAEVFGDVDADWLAEFLSQDEKQYWIAFFRTQAPYQCKAIEMQRNFAKGASINVYHSEGENLFRIALNQYAHCVKTYGAERWQDEKDMETLMDEHIPGVMYQGFNS